MRRIVTVLSVVFFIAFPFRLHAARCEWQLAAGAWSLDPFTSPVTTAATKLVQAEVDDLLAPITSEFILFSFQPKINLDSRGYFLTVSAWYKLAAEKFALGVSVSYLDFTLPFDLSAEQDFYIFNIPVAHISARGAGRIDLRTIMLKAQGRWRIIHGRRFSVFSSVGLTLLPFTGDFYLPWTITVDSILGYKKFTAVESATIAELRAENSAIPALVLSPTLAVSLHYRLTKKMQLLFELNLAPGTFLSAGLVFGR